MNLYLQDGKSPLMVASSGGHFEIAKLLLNKGAEVNHQDKVSYSSIVVIMYFASMYLMATCTCTFISLLPNQSSLSSLPLDMC